MLNLFCSTLRITKNSGSELLTAIRAHDEAKVNQILNSPFRPFWRDVYSSFSAIQAACSSTSPNILWALINAYQNDQYFMQSINAMISHLDEYKYRNFHPECLRVLLMTGTRSEYKQKALIRACMRGQLELSQVILEVCEDEMDENTFIWALSNAARFQHVDMVKFLTGFVDKFNNLIALNTILLLLEESKIWVQPDDSVSFYKINYMFYRLINPLANQIVKQDYLEHNWGSAVLKRDVLYRMPSANFLVEGFLNLNNSGFSYQNASGLYHLISQHHKHARALSKCFIMLKEANISYQDSLELYHFLAPFVVNKPLTAEHQEACSLTERFIKLHRAGISVAGNAQLYQKVEHSDEEVQLYIALEKAGVHYYDCPQYFSCEELRHHQDLATHLLEELTKSGYSYDHHKIIFNVLLEYLSGSKEIHYQPILLIKSNLVREAKKGLLQPHEPGYDQQIIDLKAIIEKHLNHLSPYGAFTFGPLNKQPATYKVESLLEKISALDVSAHKWLEFNEFGHYVFKLPILSQINLSLLLKNANLSHLRLSDEIVAKIGEIIRSLVNYDLSGYPASPLLDLFPKAHQNAVTIYVSQHYENINKLFRSEPLNPELQLNKRSDLNMLAYFLIGCLLNDFVNKLSIYPHLVPEKMLLDKIAHYYSLNISDYVDESSKYRRLLKQSLADGIISDLDFSKLAKFNLLAFLYPKVGFLDRGERLSEDTIRRRLANVRKLPAITSFSFYEKGSPYFRQEGTVRTKVENSSNYFTMNPDEGEVLFAHGEQMITTLGPNYLLSTVLRSPLVEPKDHYWSDKALECAHKYYYSEEYQEESSAIYIDGKRITRPNHNATHAYRVMIATELVAGYFAKFGKDGEFRSFCDSLDDVAFEWLRVAAAFSITGRESEISASQDRERYDRYRQASSEHFMEYVNAGPHAADTVMKFRLCNVVRYMGNPHYETMINNHPDLKERQLRNFYHRILTIAHKLDLPRCYSASEFYHSMELCRALSLNNHEQQESLSMLIRYMINLISAHGGRLSCRINPKGELYNVDEDYSSIYAETSYSLNCLFEQTESVQILVKKIDEDELLKRNEPESSGRLAQKSAKRQRR